MVKNCKPNEFGLHLFTTSQSFSNTAMYVSSCSVKAGIFLVHLDSFFFFFDGATARGGPWPPLQYASKPLDPMLCPSIRVFPSFSGPWTRHPAISFLVFLFVLLHTAFRTSFSELRCVAFFLYDQAIVFFCIL